MAIDGLGQMSTEQLLAMNMVGNGQLTNESSSTNSTSDESGLAFQLVMQNLMNEAKKNNASNIADTNNAATTKESGNSQENQANNAQKASSDAKTESINNAIIAARAIQQCAAGQNLEDLPMVVDNQYVNFTKGTQSIPSRSGVDMQKIYSAVDNASKKYGVDSNLIMAIIKQESDFNPYSTSGTGAAGLMQIMPENFAHTGITDGYDVDQNINGGTKLFKEYLNQYNGNAEMALMAYNGGPGTMQRRGVSSASDLYKMPKETQNYVPKVMGYYKNGF